MTTDTERASPSERDPDPSRMRADINTKTKNPRGGDKLSYQKESTKANRQILRARIGYRCPGDAQGWSAVYMPAEHRVWTNPFCSRRAVNRALPEEFVHATTAGFRPAQLYPLTNRLMGTNQLSDVEEFRDIVESVYVAMWPLAMDKPITFRSLPKAPEPYREQGRRILELARRFAKNAKHRTPVDAARRDALWAITMFLLYVVPAIPRQCSVILDLVVEIGPPTEWTTSPQLFDYLMSQVDKAIKAESPDNPYFFLLAAPIEVHRNIAVTLNLTRLLLVAEPAGLLPIFPSLLCAATMNSSGFLPLVWLRARGDHICAAIEIWDQTRQRLGATTSVIAERMALYDNPASSVHDCPAERFYREAVNTVLGFFQQQRPHRPAQLMDLSLTTIRKLIRRHLRPLLKKRLEHCQKCHTVIQTTAVQEAVDAILATPLQLIKSTAKEMNYYETWLLSRGLSQIEAQLELHFGSSLPILPLSMEGSQPPIVWRRL